jgi:GAF domain-containing protein
MALRILQGESPTDIPILRESPNRYIFDYEQLERFEIGLGELPAGSEVVDRPLSFIEQYQGAFWPVAGVVTFLLVVIGIQVVNVGRRQSMVEALERSNVELAEVRDSLEERVTERTQALERRSEQLQTAAEVGQEAASIRDVDELLAHTVNLISERFGFYHVSIFLVDEQGKYAVLRAASSEGGRRMLARGHRLKAGFGIVGAVLERGEPRISLDVDEDVVWYDNPDLPETRSEMGVPLKTRDHIVGVLNVQSKEPGAFSEEDVFVLQTMAEQVALAIENARLFRESRRALQELQHLYGAQMREAWTRRASERPLAYRYSGVDVERLPAAASEPSSQEDGELKVDLPLRDFSIASVALQRPDETEWSQDEVALVKAVATQAALALDNARLLEETRQRAVRERVVREITENIRGAVSIEDAVRRGLEEMQRALGASELVARLGTERDLAVDEKGDGNEG